MSSFVLSPPAPPNGGLVRDDGPSAPQMYGVRELVDDQAVDGIGQQLGDRGNIVLCAQDGEVQIGGEPPGTTCVQLAQCGAALEYQMLEHSDLSQAVQQKVLRKCR